MLTCICHGLQGEGTSLDSSADPTLREDILSTLYGGHLHVNGHEGKGENGEGEEEEEEAAESKVAEAQQGEEEKDAQEKEESKENDIHATAQGRAEDEVEEEEDDDEDHYDKREDDSGGKGEAAPAKPDKAGSAVCMSRKPVCCGMTFHTESALREHFRLSHPTQSFRAHMDSLAAGDTLLASRRPRVRTTKNGLQRVVATGRSPR